MMLEIEDLQVSYGGIQALKGISLQVEEGQIVTLIGANGAGKSTTLRAISGLERVKGGKILYQGVDITGKPSKYMVQNGLVMSTEGRRIFPDMTVLLIEQNANAALKIADRGYVLETGRITLEGTGAELLSNEAVRAAYLGKSSKRTERALSVA